MSEILQNKLEAIHNQNQPDADFANQLEEHLRTAHKMQAMEESQNIVYPRPYRMLVATITILMLIGVFASVPPLRSLAQSIIDFFVPAETFDSSENADAYADLVAVETIPEAEEIAGFDALELLDADFEILYITAGDSYISISYEQVGLDRGNVINVTQYLSGTRPETEPVSPEAYVQDVIVNGVEAEFVAGAWFRPLGQDWQWEPDSFRQLYWQQDGMSYHLRVNRPIAETSDEVIVIAEALR